MKKENAEDVKVTENPSPDVPEIKKSAAKAPKEKKPKKAKQKPQTDEIHLPVLVELTYTVSTILFIFVGLAMVIISVLTGASLLNLFLRTSAALFAMGSLLLLISSQVSSGVLQVSIAEQEETRKAQSEQGQQNESAIETTNALEDAETGAPEIFPTLGSQDLPEGS